MNTAAQPKPWLAVLLSFLAAPFGMLYVARWRWALVYAAAFAVALAAALLGGTGMLVSVAIRILTTLIGMFHAYRLAKRYSNQQARPGYSRWYGLLGLALVLLAFVFGTRAFFFEPFRIPSGAMLPTLPLGSMVLVQKWGYGNYRAFGIQVAHVPMSEPLRRGDILVHKYPKNPSMDYFKRLIGLPGDEVVYKNKQLSINGQAIARRPDGEYLDEESMRYWPRHVESLMGMDYQTLSSDQVLPSGMPFDFPFRDQCSYDAEGLRCKVPLGHYFVLGDHRDNSLDSRYWGFVPENHIVGKLVHIVR